MTEHFIIAGAQRCATTYLYRILAQHPEIEMAYPVRPEPKFFLIDSLFERGIKYYDRTFFKNKEGAWLRGEKSTSYMESEKTAIRISECYPGAKIVFLLRDPISRAISNYQFSVENGFEQLPMEEAFLREEERRANYDHNRVSASPYAYLKRGRYVDYIKMYQRYFPQENIYVIIQERLVGSEPSVRALFSFLGVRPNFLPKRINEVIHASDLSSESIEPVSPELESHLLKYFADPNKHLAELLGLDLTEWR
jgi:hypothetical protein